MGPESTRQNASNREVKFFSSIMQSGRRPVVPMIAVCGQEIPAKTSFPIRTGWAAEKKVLRRPRKNSFNPKEDKASWQPKI